MKSFLLTTAALLLALLYGTASAQTCVQADLTHPLQTTLTWVDNSTDETGFVLERSLNGGAFTALAPIAANTTQAIDTTVVRSTVPNTYTYRIKAVNGTLSSTFTSPACITFAPLLTAPTAPSGFTVSQNMASPQNILSLTWDDTTNEASYEVVGRPANGSKTFVKLATLAADTTNWDWTGLKSHTSYCGRVRAVNAKGASGYSPIACNTTSR
jgi:titin